MICSKKRSLAAVLGFVILLVGGYAQAQRPDHLDGFGDSLFLFKPDASPSANNPLSSPGPLFALGQWRGGVNGKFFPNSTRFGNDVDNIPGIGTHIVNSPVVPLVGDINGDGVADIVAAGDDSLSNAVFLGRNTDTALATGSLLLPPVGPEGSPDNFVVGAPNTVGYFLGDVDGDGRDDAITSFGTAGGPMTWGALTSDQFGLDDGTTGTSGGGVLSVGGIGNIGNQPLVGDFNGDGRTDVGEFIDGGGPGGLGFVVTVLSDANGIGTPAVGNTNILQGPAELNTNHVTALVGDLNGDGFDDIVTVDDRSGGTGSLVWVASLNETTADLVNNPTGRTFGGPSSFNGGLFLPNVNDTLVVPFLADINGDGRDDPIIYHEFTDPIGQFPGTLPTDVLAQFLVAFTPVGGDLTSAVFSDEKFFNLTAKFGQAGGWTPLAGQVHLSDDADFDIDGDVDGADFLAWQRGLGTPNALRVDGDTDGLGVVDQSDLATLLSQFGNVIPAISGAPAAAVPEPTSALLLGLGSLLVLGTRRTNRS